jgi:hypothetical protein
LEGEGDGQERKANGEETGHQVSQPAKEAGERQNSGETGQEDVMTGSNFNDNAPVWV